MIMGRHVRRSGTRSMVFRYANVPCLGSTVPDRKTACRPVGLDIIVSYIHLHLDLIT